MPELNPPAPGQFCWVELQTKDLAAAKKFYGEILGWQFEDMPMPSGTYAMAKLGGKQVAGLLAQMPEAAKAGMPPVWGCYIATADVKATTDRAAKLGGKVLLGPTPMGPGTFSVIADPSGAVFMPWHADQPMGGFLVGEPGSVVWNELLTSDADAAKRFYTELFGWKADPQPMPGDPTKTYTLLKIGDVQIGGLMAQTPDMKGVPSAWATYFGVDDADATFAKATRLGGQTMVPPTNIPGIGRFAWIQDPQGAVFAILRAQMQ